MKINVSNQLYVSDVQRSTKKALVYKFTIPNPKYLDAKKQGRWYRHLPKKLRYYELKDGSILLPRGALPIVVSIGKEHESVEVIDNTRIEKEVDFTFHGELKDFQNEAVKNCLPYDCHLLCAPTGSGKTVIGLYMIAEKKQPTLIVVHTLDLQKQWVSQINKFLKVQPGTMGGGSLKVSGNITVATIQTLIKHAEYVNDRFGHVIFDECHKAPATQYAEVVSKFDCRYITGLSATPYRNDGLTDVIVWYIGPIRHKIEKERLLKNGNLCPAEVRWVPTEFYPKADASRYYAKALSELTRDKKRNLLICKQVINSKENGVHLILSDRKAHCKELYRLLKNEGIRAEVLTGSTVDRSEIITRLQKGKSKYLIATSQLIGEGFDLPSISVLFLTTPIKFDGRLIQYIGRALRVDDGKDKAIIYDFVDYMAPVFLYSAIHRSGTYEEQRIEGWYNVPVKPDFFAASMHRKLNVKN